MHLASETIELHGANLAEVRARVKQVFINASRRETAPVDVVIIEGDMRHHLRVEPSGRIAARPADDRPLFGPDPATAPVRPVRSATTAASPAPAPPAAGEDMEDLEATVLRPAGPGAPSAPADPPARISEIPEDSDAGSPWGPPGQRPVPEETGTSPSAPDAADPAAESASSQHIEGIEDLEATRLVPRRSTEVEPDDGATLLISLDQGETDAPSGRRRAAASTEDLLPSEDTAPSARAAVAAEAPVVHALHTPQTAPAADPAPPAPPTAPPMPAPGVPTPEQDMPQQITPAPVSADPAAPAQVAVPAAPVAPQPSADPFALAPAPDPLSGTAPAPAQTDPSAGSPAPPRPTLADLQSATSQPTRVPATRGWQGAMHRLTGGAISPGPGRAEAVEREQLSRVRKVLDGPKNIAVVNLKGGAHKTTASLMIAATLGVARGGSVLAWDNNETRGTLGWRGAPAAHHHTALDLLHDRARLHSPQATVADLDGYVRPQEETRFDILASDEDAGSAALIDGEAFDQINETLSRFYRLKVIDTGNNVRASNWLAAVRSADQLVIISTVREDTFNAAAWMIDELRATGLAEQVDHAVTVLSHSSKGKFDPVLRNRLISHFGAHTRAVVEVPFEQQFVDGSPLDWNRISAATKAAWLSATAQIVDGL
ncbi:chromosome partitioning protein [Brachybacterium hainanense]|uniref:Chromosome partitioning protein n=1 Tax=Brachybacterium hainanense TaxID=1541174 RepID=A0ABV6R7A6_9MICO